MPSIYLLRHCQYANPRNILPGRLPVELSEEGIQRAEELRTEFADKNITKIYSSAVLRCKQTAEIIADGKIPIIYDQRLLETHSAYQGFWVEDADTDWNDFFCHRDELGGENLSDICARMADFWETVIKNTAENCIICSHGDPLMTLQHYLSDKPLPSDFVQIDDLFGWLEKGEYTEVKVLAHLPRSRKS